MFRSVDDVPEDLLKNHNEFLSNLRSRLTKLQVNLNCVDAAVRIENIEIRLLQFNLFIITLTYIIRILIVHNQAP